MSVFQGSETQHPGGLSHEPEQAFIKAPFHVIWKHTATGIKTNCPSYPVASEPVHAGRVEDGDLLFRYSIGPHSTQDGDPKVAFRMLDGMAGGIETEWAGIASTSASPTMTSSEGLNSTQNVSCIVAGLGTTTYTGDCPVPKGQLIFLRQSRSDTSVEISVPRAGKAPSYPIHIPRMVTGKGRSDSDCVSETLISPILDEIRGLYSDPDGTNRLVQNVEELSLPPGSELRHLLAAAGRDMYPFRSEDDDARPGPRGGGGGGGGEVDGEALARAFCVHCTDLFQEGLEEEDPTAGLQEMAKTFCYLMHLVNNEDIVPSGPMGVGSGDGALWGFQFELTQVMMKMFGLAVETQLLGRDLKLFGRVYANASPLQCRVPFLLANT